MNRENRAQLAQETLAILQSGSYQTPHSSVSIQESLAFSCAQTVLYLPGDLDAVIHGEAGPRSEPPTIHVSNRTTLEAGRALAPIYDNLVCLNFASAKNPGGGFTSGAQAQEESLARSSGLYASLQTKPEYYEFHRRGDTCLYSDRAIYSPQVPVFRTDSGQLLPFPWQTSFITAAAVNAGAIRRNEPEKIQDIAPAMEQRTRVVLSIAIQHNCHALVLGAWGCGVFQNDPTEIADVFARVLAEKPFQGHFKHIEFAVYDPSEKLTIFNAFRDKMAPVSDDISE